MSLAKMISSGDLIIPKKDAKYLFSNISNLQIEELIQTRELIVTDGNGTSFVLYLNSKNKLHINKIPYCVNRTPNPAERGE